VVRGQVEGQSAVQAALAGDTGGDEGGGSGSSLRRSSHMEFDARLVRGETAGSGAVILFDRGHRELPPLIKRRSRFLDDTIEPVLGRRRPRQAATRGSQP
jgi:hypothetical protein